MSCVLLTTKLQTLNNDVFSIEQELGFDQSTCCDFMLLILWLHCVVETIMIKPHMLFQVQLGSYTKNDHLEEIRYDSVYGKFSIVCLYTLTHAIELMCLL